MSCSWLVCRALHLDCPRWCWKGSAQVLCVWLGLCHSPWDWDAALGTTQSGSSTVPQPLLVPRTGPVPLPLPRNLLRGTPPGQQPFVRLLRCVSVTRGAPRHKVSIEPGCSTCRGRQQSPPAAGTRCHGTNSSPRAEPGSRSLEVVAKTSHVRCDQRGKSVPVGQRFGQHTGRAAGLGVGILPQKGDVGGMWVLETQR